MTFVEFIEQSQGITLSDTEKRLCNYYQSIPEEKWMEKPKRYTGYSTIVALYRVYKYMGIENA